MRHVLLLAEQARDNGWEIVVAAPAPIRATPAWIRTELLPRGLLSCSLALAKLARNSDLIHAHGPRAGAWVALLRNRQPWIWTTHGLHPLRRPADPARRLLGRLLVRSLVSMADASICVSRAEAAELRAMGVSARRVHVIPNAVAPEPLIGPGEQLNARQVLDLKADSFVILIPGRLDHAKDPLTAVQVANMLAAEGAHVLFAGSGPLEGRLRREARAGVRALGHRNDIRQLLAASDIVLNTSLWEGLPLSLLEAMWAGRPVVASAIPGNAEALGDAGVLVPVGDVPGFCSAVVGLRDEAKRRQLAERARHRVERHFPLERMLVGVDAVYHTVLAGHH